MQTYFTKHAEDKLRLLADHKANINKDKIIKLLRTPDKLAKKSSILKIAQSRLDKEWSLAVVYREENGVQMVITFYTSKT